MPVMPPDSPAEITFAITYQLNGSIEYNPTLKGSGTLSILPAGPRYTFKGLRRAMFSTSPMELQFHADEIWNVVVRGRAVYFNTQHPEVKPPSKPFVFFCDTPEQAAEVAGLMPTRLDADFTAEREFVTRVRSLQPADGSPVSVTNTLIGLNAVAFIIMGALGAGWFAVDSMMPYILYGANNGAITTAGEWWRLLTSMFIHYGLVHLLLNMWALYQAGHFLERLQGRALYALTYLGAGLAGGFASIAWHGDQSWSAGASGAVFGVYGAMIGYMLREKQAIPRTIFQAMIKSSLVFAAFNIFYGLSRTGIDNAAHLGGFVGGFALGFLVALPTDPAQRRQRFNARLIVGLGAVLALIVVGVLTTPRFDDTIPNEIKRLRSQ